MSSDHYNHEINLNSIFQNIPVGIYVSYINAMSMQGELTMMNDAFCQITEFSRREIEEKFDNRLSRLIHENDKDTYTEAVVDLNDFPHNIELNYRIVKKDGEVIRVNDRIRSVRQEDGSMRIYGCVVPEQKPVSVENKEKTRVKVETFGRFNVLVDGHPIVFRMEKSKELLALLIDRKGNYVSNREIITCLWEDDLVDKVTQSRCRKVVFNLRKTLEAYGLENLVESKIKGYRRINMEMITCDLYQYLSGEEKYKDLFQGSYLEEYSWAETTLSGLLFDL